MPGASLLLQRDAEATNVSFTVHYWISVAFLPFLVLLIPPLFLPTKWTGIRAEYRPSGIVKSLLLLSIGSCALAIVNKKTREMVLGGVGQTWCEADTVLMVFATTAMVAHLPVIAVHFLSQLATPTNPEPLPPTRLKLAILIVLIYMYAALPLAPTLAAGTFSNPEGFGEWWGFYCADRGGWRRVVRVITLLCPAIFALVMCFFIATTLYSCMGNFPPMKPTWIMWGHFALFTSCALATIAYVVVEQVLGWYGDWWPRALELLPTLVVFLCLCDRAVIRAYAHWIQGKQPHPLPKSIKLDTGYSTAILGLGQKVVPADIHYIKMSDKLAEEYGNSPKSTRTRTSSFFAPARSLAATPYHPKITQYGGGAHPSPAESLAFQNLSFPKPSPAPAARPPSATLPSEPAPATDIPKPFRHVDISPPKYFPPSSYQSARRPSKKGRKKPSLKINSNVPPESPPFVYSTASIATTITNPYKSPEEEKAKHLSAARTSREAPSYLSVLATASTNPKRNEQDVDESSLSQYSMSTVPAMPDYQQTLNRIEEQKLKRPGMIHRDSIESGSVVFMGVNADSKAKLLANTKRLGRNMF